MIRALLAAGAVAALLTGPARAAEVKDFAPRKEYDGANPPFPTKDEAKKYGASPSLVK